MVPYAVAMELALFLIYCTVRTSTWRRVESLQSAMSLSLMKRVAALFDSVVLVVTVACARLLLLLRSPLGLPLPASKHKILVWLSPYMLVPCWLITVVLPLVQ